MFGSFTERAQRVLYLSQEEARKLGHNFVGTEHILLGLAREGQGVAARALQNLGIEPDAVRREVESIIGRGDPDGVDTVGLSPRAKRVLELAIDEARTMGHGYVGTEHLLLGLIREGEGVAAQVLENLGADLDRVRAEVLDLLGGTGGAGGPQRQETSGQGAGRPAQEGHAHPRAVRAGSDRHGLKAGSGDRPDREMNRVIQVLSRRTKNNPVLIGDPAWARRRSSRA